MKRQEGTLVSVGQQVPQIRGCDISHFAVAIQGDKKTHWYDYEYNSIPLYLLSNFRSFDTVL